MDGIEIFHGTTRAFAAFDPARARTRLNAGYWDASGHAVRCCFFTTDRRAAELYCDAARNAGLPRDEAVAAVAARLERFPMTARLFADLVEHGTDVAWDRYMAASPDGSFAAHPEFPDVEAEGIDLNDLADLAAGVEGSASARRGGDRTEETMALLTGGNPYALSDLQVDRALAFGLDCRPRVLSCMLDGGRVAEASDRAEAERMLAAGAAAVRIPGDGLSVRGSDEILVADAALLRSPRSEVLPRRHEDAWDAVRCCFAREHAVLGPDDAARFLAGEEVGAETRDDAQAVEALEDGGALLVALLPGGGARNLYAVVREPGGGFSATPLPTVGTGRVLAAAPLPRLR